LDNAVSGIAPAMVYVLESMASTMSDGTRESHGTDPQQCADSKYSPCMEMMDPQILMMIEKTRGDALWSSIEV